MKVVFVIAIVASLIGCSFRVSQSKEEYMIGEKTGHHTSDGFKNDPHVETAPSLGVPFYLRRVWDSFALPDVPEGHSIPAEDVLKHLKAVEGDSITWLGHASFIIVESGKTILTDPFLSEYASPYSWAGPRRYVAPGISVEELPEIDILLISHNHYDHLDEETIVGLKGKEAIHVVVPLGLKVFFVDRGYTNVTELDWDESVTVDDIAITALPAVHNSARSTKDRDQTLWASWAIKSPSRSGMFIGDTSYYHSTFKQIGKAHGPFDYVIVPIGAYEPRELMWMSHVTPEEAVTIGTELMAETLIASHWGTIVLTDESPWEPPIRFNKAGAEKGYAKESLWAMKIGETRELSY